LRVASERDQAAALLRETLVEAGADCGLPDEDDAAVAVALHGAASNRDELGDVAESLVDDSIGSGDAAGVEAVEQLDRRRRERDPHFVDTAVIARRRGDHRPVIRFRHPGEDLARPHRVHDPGMKVDW
jgi:hypothetical protein